MTNKRLLANWTSDKRAGVPDGLKVDVAGNVCATGHGGIRIVSAGRARSWARSSCRKTRRTSPSAAPTRKTLYITGSASIYRVNLAVGGSKSRCIAR